MAARPDRLAGELIGSTPPRSTPPELKAVAAAAFQSNLPVKSKAKYEKAYKEFLDWCITKNVPDGYYTPNVLVSYFEELKGKYAPTTLWSTYSKLKKTLLAHRKVNIDDSPFKILKDRMKSFGVDYEPKKSRLFTLDEVYDFCRRADDKVHLCMKLVALLGITGALRHVELYELAPTDITDRGNELHVRIRSTKPHRAKMFIALANTEAAIDPVGTYRRYLALRPTHERASRARHSIEDALFVNYRNGVCTTQRIGKKTIAKMPERIAAFLKLNSPGLYTGHAFRRTSATAAVNNGADLLTLKKLGDWKSDSVAQGYLDDSDALRRKRSALVQGVSVSMPPAKEARIDVPVSLGGAAPVLNITGCTNVYVNLVAPGCGTIPK